VKGRNLPTDGFEATEQWHGLVNTLIFLLCLQIFRIAELLLAISWIWKLEVSFYVLPGSLFFITTRKQQNYASD